ncbi:hypothetical protein PR202_ga22535 [Eleusine coracana subsp. coracana]|uniref:Uncharacterized protein n=1 Tax=Eleusine coracana subsp. coracana TaxID=191504 RepID=A0AAV5D3W9_ELECO|nr:hypothetical protein PR202_ga22535 [Eleusine coracana subsp. coracana]
MEFATGALGTLLLKLAQLLHGEYRLQKNVRKNIEFLKKELEFTHAALLNVGEVPPEQLKEVVRIWARDARELSYDMEDVVDSFLVRVHGPDPPSKRSSKRFIQKMKGLLTISKRHQIGEQIEDIKQRVVEVAARRDRYKVDIISRVATLDPRVTALYAKATELIGLNEAREELLMLLAKKGDMSAEQQRIVSIVGFGGLGKTTLAKAVFEELKLQFDCTAFVTVSRSPDIKKFLKDMLYELDRQKYGNIHSTSLDVKHLIDQARGFLQNKRYFVIIDDIWDISNWEIIKYSLPDDNSGCSIVTTTRNFTVAKHIGGEYKMRPLSLENSRLLLYRRIFGDEDSGKYLDKELAEVSDRILKKCAGVPLAITTIGSLLARKARNKVEWYEVYNSIGTGMENNLDAENMRKILSYSYYDLPSRLRTCLLYFSIFPEDCEIETSRLIRLWVAEGFIPCEEQGKSQFEVGESHFNELINRSLIQPLYIDDGGKIFCCHVHDMVLDLIRSLSSAENFVTILSDMDYKVASTTIRRLSVQNGKVDHPLTQGTRSMPQVRSVVVFASTLDQMPTLQSLKVLRVLDLQGCDLSHGYSLKYLGNLFHLRYLGLSDTSIPELPEEVGNLQFLESLNVWGTEISCLPLTVAQLKKLMYLRVQPRVRVSNWIGNLTSLEALSVLHIHDELMNTVEVLGLLTKLRVLHIWLSSEWNDKLVDFIGKLRKIKSLRITSWDKLRTTSADESRCNIGDLDAWVPPGCLRRLDTISVYTFARLPVWMNPSYLLDLSQLSITVRELQQKDIDILGRLPALRCLSLVVDHEDREIHRRLVVAAGSFPCLVRCNLWGFVQPLMFRQGAMPSLTLLQFTIHARKAREIAGGDGGFGLENLPSLQKALVNVGSEGVSKEDVEEAKVVLKQATEIHHNHPILRIFD